LNQKTRDSINASKVIAPEDSLNPYNYQPSISTKQSGDVRRFSESNPLNDPNTKTFLKGVSNLIFGGALFVTGMSIFLSGGLTLIPIIMATGGVLYGSSKAQEGIHQVFLGANGKGEEKSFNYLRDTVFQGNQAVYDAVGMISTFGPALPTIVKAIPQLAAPILGAFGLKQVVYEATGSEELSNLATDAMMFGPALQQVNKAINPGQMDDIIIQTSDEALNFVDDVLDDGVKNTVDNVVDDTANQVTSEASALEGGLDDIFKSGRVTKESISNNLSSFSGKSADEIADVLRNQGYDVTVRNSTKSSSGAQIIEIGNAGNGRNITQVQVSPGGGRHGSSPYIKISTSDQGIFKIVNGDASDYISNAVEKATIFFTGGK